MFVRDDRAVKRLAALACLVLLGLQVADVRAAAPAAGGGYSLTASPSRQYPGGNVDVSWIAPSGGVSPSDWIGLYSVGADNHAVLTYQYTGGATSGTLAFTMPIAVGLYEFRYLLNDGYLHVAVSNTVQAACTNDVVGPKVLLLSGGDLGSDCAGARILEGRGFNVTVGPAVPSWDGTQFDLSEFVVVVVPHNFNWASRLNDAGVDALSDFVLGGGGLVSGEWTLWGAFSRNQTGVLGLAPIENYCGFNYAPSTTYSRATLDPLIHAGLPASFNIALRNMAGTESCFRARPEATVFFTSSNGGGQSNADGLVGWAFGRGHVASFSTLLTSLELSSTDYARLFANTVDWASHPVCTAEPATPQSLAAFVGCLAGPGAVFDHSCDLQDLDCSGRVDLRDVAFFQRTFGVP